jgi:hypothetical protein
MRWRTAALVLALLFLATFQQPCNADPNPVFVVVSAEDAVIACWEGRRPVALRDCVGREAVDISNFWTGRVGKIAEVGPSENFDWQFAGTTESAAWIPSLVRFYTVPITAKEYSETPEANLNLWSPAGFPNMILFQAHDGSEMATDFVPPLLDPTFNKTNAAGILRSRICPNNEDCLDAVLWTDIDRDGEMEGVATPLFKDSESWCFDLLLVRLNGKHALKDADGLAHRTTAMKCANAQLLEYSEGNDLSLVPWPSAGLGLALRLNMGAGGGDAYDEYYIPVESLSGEIKVAATYTALYLYRQ